MKKLLPFLILLTASVSCLKDDSGNRDPRFMSVEQYISLLKSGNFSIWEMPIFEISDIPKFLKYVHNETRITIDVNHPISSHFQYQKFDTTLGMMALWTIEGVRLDVDLPSSTPTVKDSFGQNATQKEIAGLYERWWEKNKGKTHAQLKEISPFEGTNYSWH